MFLVISFQHKTVHAGEDNRCMQCTTARKLTQKAYVTAPLLQQCAWETGALMSSLFILLHYPGDHVYTQDFRSTLLPRGHIITLGCFFCQKGCKMSAENSMCWELRSSGLPEADLVTAVEGKCLSLATCMVGEMWPLYYFVKWQGWILLQHILLCVWISPLIEILFKTPNLLLKIPLRSLEADRTKKESPGLHKLS